MVFEKKLEKKFDDTERYKQGVKGLEEYMGAVGDICIYPVEPNGRLLYSLSTLMMCSSGSTSSETYVEIDADSASKRFEILGCGGSEVQVNDVLNKLLLSLVMGRSSVSKKR